MSGAGPLRRRWLPLLAALVVVLPAAACGSDGPSDAACSDEATGGPVVRATVGEWFITPSPNRVPAGRVVLRVVNTGDKVHEVLVVRAASRSDLPLTDAGALDEYQLPSDAFAGEVTDVPAGGRCSTELQLAAGSYFLVCNLTQHPKGSLQESHLREGMIAPLTAT